MRALIRCACLAIVVAINPAARAQDQADTIYDQAGRAFGHFCAEMWSIKDVAALDAKEAAILVHARARIDHIDRVISDLSGDIEKAALEYKEKDTTLNLSTVDAIKDFALTGGSVDTNDLKSFGKSLAQGGSAVASAGKAEAALHSMRTSRAKVEDLRHKLAEAIILKKIYQVTQVNVIACAKDQRDYLGGGQTTGGPVEAGSGWAGDISGEVKMKCEQGMIPPDPNKTWEETVRFAAHLNPPQAGAQANTGRGTIDFGGASHKIAGFASSGGEFALVSKQDYRSISLTGKISRTASGALTSSGNALITQGSPAKVAGTWTGTKCTGTYSF